MTVGPRSKDLPPNAAQFLLQPDRIRARRAPWSAAPWRRFRRPPPTQQAAACCHLSMRWARPGICRQASHEHPARHAALVRQRLDRQSGAVAPHSKAPSARCPKSCAALDRTPAKPPVLALHGNPNPEPSLGSCHHIRRFSTILPKTCATLIFMGILFRLPQEEQVKSAFPSAIRLFVHFHTFTVDIPRDYLVHNVP